MSVEVVAAGQPPTEEPLTTAPEPTQFSSLLLKKKAILNALHKDIEVPGWDRLGGEKVFLRVRPLTSDEFDGPAKKYGGDKAGSEGRRGLLMNCEWIVKATIAIFAKTEDCDCLAVDPQRERCEHMKSLSPGNPDGPFTTFSDPSLAQILECTPTAAATCEALFLREGDLLVAAGRILRFSGFAQNVADEDF